MIGSMGMSLEAESAGVRLALGPKETCLQLESMWFCLDSESTGMILELLSIEANMAQGLLGWV